MSLNMSTTWRKVLKTIGVVVVAVGLVAIGFALGRSSLSIGGFFPDRYRLSVLGLGFGWGGILMILFWVLIIGGAAWLVSSFVAGRPTSSSPMDAVTPPESPLDILKKRYARGEITKAEYEDMCRDLSA
jgi:putative membrane protein